MRNRFATAPVRQKENDMYDSIQPAMPGFVSVRTRTGWQGLLAIDVITHVFPRTEGGTSLRIDGVKTLLLDVPFKRVVETLQKAGQGGDHA
jgi:hypothetical protein